MTAPEEVSFDEVAREALKDAKEVFREEGSSATPNPPAAWVEDPLLRVEGFVEEERVDPTPSESDAQPNPTSPASTPTQAPGSAR